MVKHRIYSMSFGTIYPLYIAKAEKKGRTKAEVDEIISWLFGYDETTLQEALDKEKSFEDFIEESPRKNPLRSLITGKVCGVQVDTIEDPLMREIRYLDKLIDELAKGKPMEKILRSVPPT